MLTPFSKTKILREKKFIFKCQVRILNQDIKSSLMACQEQIEINTHLNCYQTRKLEMLAPLKTGGHK